MQKVTAILAIIGIALVATALVGLTYAQLSTPTPTATPANPTATPWWSNRDPNVSAPYCYNGGGYNAGHPSGRHG